MALLRLVAPGMLSDPWTQWVQGPAQWQPHAQGRVPSPPQQTLRELEDQADRSWVLEGSTTNLLIMCCRNICKMCLINIFWMCPRNILFIERVLIKIHVYVKTRNLIIADIKT